MVLTIFVWFCVCFCLVLYSVVWIASVVMVLRSFVMVLYCFVMVVCHGVVVVLYVFVWFSVFLFGCVCGFIWF